MARKVRFPRLYTSPTSNCKTNNHLGGVRVPRLGRYARPLSEWELNHLNPDSLCCIEIFRRKCIQIGADVVDPALHVAERDFLPKLPTARRTRYPAGFFA